MHKKFDSTEIEKKWQQKWEQTELYATGERNKEKEKEYVLVELPYPSGNLHIGHWYAFAVPDIYVRYRKMTGIQAIYPMGFDAFGLPAENAAIKRNINPREWTESNIEYMKGQLKSMGNAFSWDKTASTIDPDYYKWTQWMFNKFFENDIAYRGKGVVNWCPGCNTVIANEQVQSDGTCERCDSEVEKREMPQWMLRITDFADSLVDDLDELDWPEHIKDAQRNWIGRSKGAEIDFNVSIKGKVLEGKNVKVFTTRPDTLFGVTYLVLAPELTLELIQESDISNLDEVKEYIKTVTQKEEKDRLDNTKEKTGIKLEGVTAINPANGKEVPVFIADYVLAGYGTGAIMAVPAHDERDKQFAKKFNISQFGVVWPYEYQKQWPTESEEETQKLVVEKLIKGEFEHAHTGAGILINSGEFNGMDSETAKELIVKKVGGKLTNTYRLRDWSIGRQRYWGVPIPIVYDPEGNAHAVPEEHLPWTLPEDVDYKPTGEAPLAKSVELKKRTEEIFGAGWTPEVETMDTFVDSSWYFLRYIDNQCNTAPCSIEEQNNWMPVDLYFGGAEHTTMHLLYSRFWQKALYKLGLVTTNEPYKRRLNRGLILGPDGNKMSKSKGNVIDPDEQVAHVGADTVKMYLAFMGPYGEVVNYPWDMGGIAGIRRFLERVYGLREHVLEEEEMAVTKQLHFIIDKAHNDMQKFKFNTVISSLMEFVNKVEKTGLSQESYEIFLRLLAPLAPHLTEELWSQAGHDRSIHLEAYPVADKTLLTVSEVTIGVQVNGKHRGSIVVAPDAAEEAVKNIALENESVIKWIAGEPKKIIYVPGRILNIIV